MKQVPVSFAEGMFKSFAALLLFVLGLGVWSYWGVECGGIQWVLAVAAAILFFLALWLFCHLVDWTNGIVQALIGGVNLSVHGLLAATSIWLTMDMILWGLTAYVGWLAFGAMACRGVSVVTIIYTSGLALVGVIVEIVVFNAIDWPNDALDSWVAKHQATPAPTNPLIELQAQKLENEAGRVAAQRRLAEYRAREAEQFLLPMGQGQQEYSIPTDDEGLGVY